MGTHRTLDGQWAHCTAADCELKFHFPGMTVAEAENMPFDVLLPLLNTIDPPSFVNPSGQLWWEDDAMHMHRDYDLPSFVVPGHVMEWWQHGQLHRENAPAVIYLDSSQLPGDDRRWYTHGARHFDSETKTKASGWVDFRRSPQ